MRESKNNTIRKFETLKHWDTGWQDSL